MARDIHEHRILILDFGSQYTQLIARRVREIGVYCEIWPWDIPAEEIAGFEPMGIVLSGLDRLPLVDLDSGLTPREDAIVWDIRMPRVVLGVLVGSMLSSAGAAYQGVFRNPLADPYLLGVAAGAGLGATLAIVGDLGDGRGVFDLVTLVAFAGALTAASEAGEEPEDDKEEADKRTAEKSGWLGQRVKEPSLPKPERLEEEPTL